MTWVSVRSPAGAYTREKETRAIQAELAAKQAATDKKPAPGPAPQLGSHPALANPNSVTDADSMMSWENRDIEAQQETVAQLQKELDGAPPERREALQKLLQERMQVLVESRKELQALQAKKQELQQKASAGSDASIEKLPSQ